MVDRGILTIENFFAFLYRKPFFSLTYYILCNRKKRTLHIAADVGVKKAEVKSKGKGVIRYGSQEESEEEESRQEENRQEENREEESCKEEEEESGEEEEEEIGRGLAGVAQVLEFTSKTQ
jgi:hypothetical protein